MTRHKDYFSELWKTLPWKKFQRIVNRLQRRLFKAMAAGDKRKICKLQRLLLKSRSARFLAIRQVTQLNAGKKTAGVDGKSSLDFQSRFELEELLRVQASDWKHQGLRKIPIPKKDGTTRMLKVPTIADRAWQKLVHNGKFRSTPSMDNYRKFRRKVKDIVNCSHLSTEAKATKLAPIVRGWREYHKYCDMSDHHLWHMNHATYKRFRKDKNSDLSKAKSLTLKAYPTVDFKQNGHISVKGTCSPYDGNIVYWAERNSKLYKGMTASALKRQNFRCGKCNLVFNGDEKVHLHHNDGNHGNNKPNNLTALHESCHDYTHMSIRKGK